MLVQGVDGLGKNEANPAFRGEWSRGHAARATSSFYLHIYEGPAHQAHNLMVHSLRSGEELERQVVQHYLALARKIFMQVPSEAFARSTRELHPGDGPRPDAPIVDGRCRCFVAP